MKTKRYKTLKAYVEDIEALNNFRRANGMRLAIPQKEVDSLAMQVPTRGHLPLTEISLDGKLIIRRNPQKQNETKQL